MPDNSVKISADITFNTKQVEQQFNQLGNTVAKSVSASKQIREMTDSFNKISTRGMDKQMTKVVEGIRSASKESQKFEGYISSANSEIERLKAVARSKDFNPLGSTDESLQMSQGYKNLIKDVQYYQEEIRKTQELLARGTKTVRASEGDVGYKKNLAYGEQQPVITKALNPDEIAKAEQYLSSLQGKIQGVETEMQNMEQRGDAFPQLTNNIESSVISLNRMSEKMVTLYTQFINLSNTASQATSATQSSLGSVYDAMNKFSAVNMAQPVQTQASEIEQSMQNVVQATTDGTQQVQQQVDNVKQAVTQPVQAQIVDTTAIQNQLTFLSGMLASLVSSVNTQMSSVASAITSGFENTGNIVNNKVDEINQSVENMSQRSATAMNHLGVQVGNSMQQAVSQLSDRVTQLESVVGRARSATSRVGTNAVRSSKTAVVAFGSIEKSIKGAFNSATKLASAVGGKLTSSFNRVQKSVEKAFSGRTFKRGLTTILKYGFGVRSLYFAFRKLRTAVKEGLQNLVQYEKAVGTSKDIESTNYAITRLNTALLYLKNAWAAAFAPVINVVAPILDSIVTRIAEVGNAIARFVGALTGQSVVLNAVKVDAQDYADSLDNTKDSANGASGAAKKLSDRLASFDDLNVLGKDSDTSGSGGGGADFEDYMPDPSEMFTYVDATSELADTVKKYIDKIKESWETGDFTWLGETLKNKIIEGLDWLNGQWGEIQGYADKIGHSVGSVLVGLFGDPELWEKAGQNIGEAINTVNIGISAFLDELDKIPFGENAGKGVNELLQTADWELASDNINRAITGVLDNITEFVNTLNATDIVDAITKFVTGLDIPEIVADVEKLAISVADLVITVVGGLTWQAGQSFGDFLIDWVTKDSTTAYKTDDGIEVPIEIDMTPTTDYSTNPIGALIERMVTGIGANWTNGVVNILVGFGISDDKGDALNDILTLLDNTKETFSDWGDEIKKTFEPVKKFFDDIGQFFKDTGDAIGTTLEVIGLGFEGLGEIFTLGAEDIGGGIVTFMVDFVDAFEDFGDKWDEFWTNMEGFDIEDLLDGVGDFVAEEIIAPFVDFFDTFSGYGKDIIDGLSSGISEAFGTAKDWVNTHIVDPIVSGFCELFGIHSPSTVAEGWGTSLIEGLKQGIDNIISTVMEPFNQLQADLLEKWNTIKGDAYEKWVGMKTSITEKASEIKSDTEEKFETLKTNLVNKWQEIKGAIYEKLVGIKLNMVEVFEQMKEAVKAPINGFLGIIETMVNRVIEGVNSVADTFNALPDVTLTNPFTGTDYSLGFSIPHLSYVSIPRLAEGAVIPPNREFMAVLGDQSNGTNIEAPLDTIKQAVAEVLANNGNAEMIQLLQQLITVVENKNLVIGDKDIGRANARYVKQQNIVRGSTF